MIDLKVNASHIIYTSDVYNTRTLLFILDMWYE